MQEQYRLLVDEQLICGLQIHVGVSNRDLAVQIMQRVARHLPMLLALSASSPYWNGQDTGYSSIRTIIWQRWPSAGATGRIESAQEYDELLDDLINSGVIADRKMAYFDVRPSAHAPTLELRVCDACPIVDDAVLIAGLFRGLVRAAEHEIAEAKPFVPFPAPIHRAAIWRAARGGFAGELLDDSRHPRPIPATQAVRDLLGRLRPYLTELGDFDEVEQLVATALARGNSADRQRAAMAERGELDDVVELVVDETQGPPEGLPAEVPELRTYRSRAGDEAVGLGHRPRPVYHDIVDHFRALGPAGWRRAEERRDRWTDEHDLTFGVESEHRRFHVDLVPRALSPHEWASLRAGLIQRARAIESFLEDVYGDQRVLADGLLPTDRVVGALRLAAGGDPTARRARSGRRSWASIWCATSSVAGGCWRTTSATRVGPRTRSRSGIWWTRCCRTCPGRTGCWIPTTPCRGSARRCSRHAEAGTSAALFSTGPHASAWFEHRLLAERAGLLLVTADDLEVRDGRVRHRGSGRSSGRSTCGWTTSWSMSSTGTVEPIGAEVFEVAAAGQVVLANAPGNGVADDKAMYCYVPELIGYYLEERPLLESVPTYRTSDETERRIVLERVGELVTKPVDGHGGHGVLIGPDASASAVAHRRAEIAADPAGWVAQEVVALSSHPTFADGGAAAPARGPARLRVPSRHRGRRLRARPAGAHPGRPRGQPGRQLLPGRRREGHLDHRRLTD